MKHISDAYAKMNSELHTQFPDYGTHGRQYARSVVDMCEANGLKTVLDFGCGKGTLKTAIAEIAPQIAVAEYDPAIAGKDTLPKGPFDLVVCTDVLEHVEPGRLDNVLATIHKMAARGVLLEACVKRSSQTLPDGRNAHLIVQPAEWWIEKISVHFKIAHLQHKETAPRGIIVTGLPL